MCLGPIYDPDEAERLIETYLEHGDLMGWGGNDLSCEEVHEDFDPECEEEEEV